MLPYFLSPVAVSSSYDLNTLTICVIWVHLLEYSFTTASLFFYFQLAQKELQKINMYKAPRDKLVCILNCCKVINNLLLNASIALNENPPGADEFLPVLIYVTIKVRSVVYV